ncbi:hypothetical protein MMC30_006987 [Trapelia coarctata]|nr:hypothetical protein [Trapelia coarctata]
MPRPKRQLLATAEETSNPPTALEAGQAIARVIKGEGKNLYSVALSDCKPLLVELPSRFRSTIWIKHGGFVLVDTTAFDDRENKLDGEIVNVVRDERRWRKQTYWPSEFTKKSAYPEDSDEEESTVGKMPPAVDSDAET